MKKILFISVLFLSFFYLKAQTYSITIAAAQINAGDSVRIVANSNTVEYLQFILNAGTDYTGTGTDSTLVWVYKNSVATRFAYIPDTWIESTNSLQQKLFFEVSHDSNSPIWVKFPSQYTTGTRTLTIIYKKR
jgi:hypothetical protein